jgi:gamma-glutamyl-gamma-aminobutyrate hydrolase PuuD
MHNSRPIIAITFSAGVRRNAAARQAAEAYCQAVAAHGAEVMEVVAGEAPPDLGGLEGLLLAGGVDVEPGRYGEAPHPKLGQVEGERDELELGLTRRAMARGIPLLGICRGSQVLGVAFGGKLRQDLPSELGTEAHKARGEVEAWHSVRVAPGSRLHAILQMDSLEVNSFHHQANGAIGAGLRAVAWAEDGVIEAVEGEADGFVLGVEWHPERMAECAANGRLFAAFVESAGEYARARRRRGCGYLSVPRK